MYDYIVIGAGSGGVRFARLMGAKGFKVAVVEGSEVGGTCVLRGCIPKKLFIYASNFGKETALAIDYGWKAEKHDFDINVFMDKKEAELKRLNGIYLNLLKNNNVELIKGYAKFKDATSIVVGDRVYRAKKFIISTGGVSKECMVEGGNLTINSDQFLDLRTIPKSTLILGGGYIAVEFAKILVSLGTKVFMFIRSGIPLRSFDADVASFIKVQLEATGVNFVNAKKLLKLQKDNNSKIEAIFDTDEKLTVDNCINAIGRDPNSAALNLKAAGVEVDQDLAIKVDDFFTTTNPNIHAIGDVINYLNLTPVAIKQAMFLIKHFTDKEAVPEPLDYHLVPKTAFCYPEVASCGFSEDEAKSKGFDVEIYKTDFRPLSLVITSSKVRSFFKIVVDKPTQKVLGIHIVDPSAGEIIQGFAVALKLGVTKQQLDSVVGVHPTSAEELVTLQNKTS